MLYSLTDKRLKKKNVKCVLIDVNSVFLFTSNPVKNLYNFISILRRLQGNETKIVNVIDNGQCKKLTKKFKFYKKNRYKVSSYSTNLNLSNKYKANISRIFNIDSKYKNNLTYYYEGESDFKIGYILKQLIMKNVYNTDEILVVSKDKDLIISVLFANVLIFTYRNKKPCYFLIDSDVKTINEYLNYYIPCLKLRQSSDFFYYLVLSGDKIDNIKKILTNSEICNIFNQAYSNYNKINIEILLKNKKIMNKRDILYQNINLIDIFNENAFTFQQRTFMDRALNYFFGNIRE